MPNFTDPNLYPHHKPKTKVHSISTSSSLAFNSTLSSLLSNSATRTTAPGRTRPSKAKEDIFATHNKNAKKRAAKDLEDNEGPVFDERGRRRDRNGNFVGAAEEADERMLHRSKKKMEEKVKRYNELKRGGGEDNDLVDFDRKWAERGGESSSDDEDDNDQSTEIVDYQDEYGRARQGTRAEAERVQRRLQNKLLGAEELDRMSARPVMPEKLIYGDTVQTMAFNPDDETTTKMEELAKKRDRSLTPPDDKHYEADKEFRIKGVGFYGFSQDKDLRAREMEALENERKETERVRKEREEKKQARMREIEERRRAIGAKRAQKQAENFLEGLGSELGDKSENVPGNG